MYSNIKQKRANGIERSERELAGDPGVFGELRVHRVGGYRCMYVREWGNNAADNRILPELWEPEIEGWVGPILCFRGWQRVGGRAEKNKPTYLQEWLVTVVGEHPPADVVRSMRRA